MQGAGGFVGDIAAPDAAEICIVRSREPHAILRAIRTQRALASPGVIAILTASDLDLADDVLPCVDMIPGTLDVRQRVMARDRVRYVGQPVALVVAANRYLAEDAAALVEVDYESLPAVTDHMAAMDPGATLLYLELGTNVVYQVTQRDGDADFAARDGDLVIRKRFESTGKPPFPWKGAEFWRGSSTRASGCMWRVVRSCRKCCGLCSHELWASDWNRSA